MTSNIIECKKCGNKISLSEALSADAKEEYKKELQQVMAKDQAEVAKLKDHLAKEQAALTQKQIDADKLIQEKLQAERGVLENKIRQEVSGKNTLEMTDLKNQINENKKLVDEYQKNELELRAKTRQLEEKEKNSEIEIQRRLDSEKNRIQEEVARKITDENRLKAAEKDKQLDDMRKQIEDLKRKAEQGSQQSQGEILEIEIESTLKSLFPHDVIEPVPKGISGGDIIQKVTTPSGQHTGTIVWETKRTKSWSDGWISKLKDDQRSISAECAVIVTQVMPKDTNGIAFIEGVWICDFFTFHGIATALRFSLTQVHQAKAVAVGKGEKMDFLYNYLTGTQFKQRVEVIVESYRTMREELEKEKRSIQKSWASREQQISRVLTSTVGMYGDLQGIVGATLPKIESLEFNDPESSSE